MLGALFLWCCYCRFSCVLVRIGGTTCVGSCSCIPLSATFGDAVIASLEDINLHDRNRTCFHANKLVLLQSFNDVVELARATPERRGALSTCPEVLGGLAGVVWLRGPVTNRHPSGYLWVSKLLASKTTILALWT